MHILLLEDHPIFRFGLQQLLLRRWPDARCSEAGTLQEALLLVRSEPVDLALVDLNLPDTEGLEPVSHLLRAREGLRVLVLSLNDEAAYAQRVLKLGAAGYLPKDRAAGELVGAVERVLAGGRYISADLAEHLADRLNGGADGLPHEQLSAQEYRVLLQLAAGRRVADIAAGMHLSPKTVSTYRTRVLEKIGVDSNAELARYCLQHGLDPAGL